MQTFCALVIYRFPWFIGAYFVLQVVVRLLVTEVAVLDESEQLMLSQYFAWGYNQQPPLYTWVQMLVFQGLGVSLLGLSVLKNAWLFLLYFYLYQTGLLLSGSRVKAALAALSLLLLPQFVWGAQVDQIHTVMLSAATAMTVYYFCKIALREAAIKDFALLGVAVAVGLLAKYNFVLVIASLLGIALLLPSFRDRLLEKRMAVTAAVAVAAALPHFGWFMDHLVFATSLTTERMGVTGAVGMSRTLRGWGELLVAVLTFISPFWLIFAGFFGKRFHWRHGSAGSRALLIYMALALGMLVVIIWLMGVTSIKERWLQPYLYLVPLWLFLHTTLEADSRRVKAYVMTCVSVAAVVALIMIVRPLLIDARGKPSRANYPFAAMAEDLNRLGVGGAGTLFHADDMFIGGNIRLFFPDATVITPEVPMQPYTIGQKVVFVFQERRPELLPELENAGFSCNEYRRELLFTHSDDLFYAVNYALCRQRPTDMTSQHP